MKWLKVLLVVGLLAVVGMAFRVSWNALRDIAAATGADPGAANLYPFVVDGLLVVALVAALVLTGKERRFALRVLGAYTAASLALNYVHGMVPGLHRPAGMVRLAEWGPAHWTLVLLATSLPVGAIYFGSDLVAKVLHYRPTLAGAAPAEGARSGETPAAEVPEGPVIEPVPEVYPEPVLPVPEVREVYPQRPPVVPGGVRLLPIRCAPRHEIRHEIPEPPAPDPAPVLAADAARTRDVVHAEYVPLAPDDPWAVDGTYAEDEPTAVPEDDQVLTPDPYTEQARQDHAELLAAGKTPSIRQLRNHYGVGQARAQRIQDELKRIPA